MSEAYAARTEERGLLECHCTGSWGRWRWLGLELGPFSNVFSNVEFQHLMMD